MFEGMVARIERDLVRYVMHVQVKEPEEQQTAAPAVGTAFKLSGDEEPAVADMKTSGPSDPSGGGRDLGSLASAEGAPPKPVEESAPASNTPVVKSDWDKTPRNAPCPCGSGKKFKLCHGKS
ncbi:SEC-C metal-binding domain-containing protein [Actinospongicola halichondriae]|uniref:SEC-C metal-binding domain-containing protein n=1 Tax=Actinospongicola halichondriae TaxID=3236844 RepID=UPI003F52A80E